MRAYVLRLDGLGISHKAGKVRVLRTNGLGLAWSGTHLLLPPGGASRLLVKRCHGDGHDCLSLTPHTQGNMAATRLARLRPRQRAHPYPCSLPCALPASHAMPCPVPLLDSPCPPPFERSSIDGRLGQAQKERNRQVLGADRLLLLLPVAPLSPSWPCSTAVQCLVRHSSSDYHSSTLLLRTARTCLDDGGIDARLDDAPRHIARAR